MGRRPWTSEMKLLLSILGGTYGFSTRYNYGHNGQSVKFGIIGGGVDGNSASTKCVEAFGLGWAPASFDSTHQRNFVNRQIKATSMPIEYWKKYLDEDAWGPLRVDGLYDFQHFYLGYTYNKASGKVEDVLGNEVSSELDIKWDTNVASWLNCVYMAKGFFNGVRCSQGLTFDAPYWQGGIAMGAVCRHYPELEVNKGDITEKRKWSVSEGIETQLIKFDLIVQSLAQKTEREITSVHLFRVFQFTMILENS